MAIFGFMKYLQVASSYAKMCTSRLETDVKIQSDFISLGISRKPIKPRVFVQGGDDLALPLGLGGM